MYKYFSTVLPKRSKVRRGYGLKLRKFTLKVSQQFLDVIEKAAHRSQLQPTRVSNLRPPARATAMIKPLIQNRKEGNNQTNLSSFINASPYILQLIFQFADGFYSLF